VKKRRLLCFKRGRYGKVLCGLRSGGNSISGRVVRHQRVPVFDGHRLPSTASRRDIPQVICCGIMCFLCVFFVAVMAKCFVARG
jgi:hypothetical protein